jgi:site-specific recombinase XerD
MKDLSKQFKNYLLQNTNINVNSLKYYLSDISHFKAWFILKIRASGVFAETFIEAIPFINKHAANEYYQYLLQNNIPPKTINRRLSTLRHLARFFLLSQVLNFDFMTGISNVSLGENKADDMSVIEEFGMFLKDEKVSSNTHKNYMSDVKQFYAWLKNNQAVSQN